MKAPAAYSIRRRLFSWMLFLALAVLGAACATIYAAAWVLHDRAQDRILALKVNKLTETAQSLLRRQDDAFLRLLQANAQRRPGTRLELLHPDGRTFYRDPQEEPHQLSRHRRSVAFELPYADRSGTPLAGSFAIDVEHDVRILDSLAVVLVLTTLAGAAAAALLAGAAVRRGLQPLRMLTRQTERISVGGSGNRLGLARPVEELQPWIAEFNSLLDRMERSYARLEAFNADVAHELRTPLTALIGKTELALSRTRGAMELGATLEGNLEELQRISTIVNDMLFLSRSDRGAAARLAPPMGLRGVAQEVAEFHEAAAGERHLTIDVVGDVEAAVDESLLKRALSNLLENATRHARPCTVVRVLLADATGTAMLCVENEGPQIPPRHLPHLFDRFYRAEVSRESSDSHHGLGLAIVAAIARMHGGSVFADSDARRTRVGLTIPRAPAGPRQARPHETRMTAMSSA